MITLNEGVRRWLAEKGYDPVYGARPLRRLIQSSIEDMLAEELLSGELAGQQTIQILLKDDDTLGYESVHQDESVLEQMMTASMVSSSMMRR